MENSAAQQKFVGEILVRRGALEESKLPDLLRTAEEKDARLLDLLQVTGDVRQDAVVRALAEEVGIEFRDKLAWNEIPAELIDRVPINFARQHRVLPLETKHDGRVVYVAVANPLDPTPLDDLRALLGCDVLPIAATSEAIEDAINRVYERKNEEALGEAKAGEEVEELQDLIDMTDEAPVIRWVNNLFYQAAQQRASDIHIEPSDKEVQVRYRVDGNLHVAKTAHKGFLQSIVSRVKIEAGLNIAEKRLPQDGRITKKIAGRLIDVRVSTIPTSKGERIVMRLLDKEKTLLDLEDLGYSGAYLETLHHLATRPNGIILVTGPTGSGKTTTLYAALSRINTPDLNILTAEDPVEYELRGIGQMHVQAKIGLTFAAALRSFLRQDPDVIMVGEIRDHETAEIAIHASLTGHLVLSTIHTNDAAGAITRLVEMGTQPFLISSSLLAAVAQRLVRRLCVHCRQPYEPTDQDFRSLGVDRSRLAGIVSSPGVQPWTGLRTSTTPPDPADGGDGHGQQVPWGSEDDVALLDDEPTGLHRMPTIAAAGPAKKKPNGGAMRPVFYRAVGCSECSHTGYRGRIAIAEILMIDEPVRREILNQSDAVTITRAATARGMRTLREDGARQVVLGITSLEEVLAATQAGDLE
ncbi:GspE/PulE family protein [Sandaracinus amylolyticus]|uniref:Type IV fimbrial assembly, ATPase PilB n=1 Tax=Sandaracinus amylolyticus TaxID=927083 RepID=A0A0F6SDR7_9BACT|nr:ATPase, T2SS/T4P/T4SS family [Sandaracinus amylolyticus]AKF03914.1 Type IV fimbrial assembly, ATPase PilB [Sandaracinus amylolyticus]